VVKNCLLGEKKYVCEDQTRPACVLVALRGGKAEKGGKWESGRTGYLVVMIGKEEVRRGGLRETNIVAQQDREEPSFDLGSLQGSGGKLDHRSAWFPMKKKKVLRYCISGQSEIQQP